MRDIQLHINLPFSWWLKRDPSTGTPLVPPTDRLLSAYTEALKREISSLGADMEDCNITDIHFTGGYMSLLQPDDFDAMMACVHRAFHMAEAPRLSGVLFPGSIDMALASCYKNYSISALMFEVPSLLPREAQRYHLPLTLNALQHSAYLMENFGMNGLGLRIPAGVPERDDAMRAFIVSELRRFRPCAVELMPWPYGGDPTDREALACVLTAAGLYEQTPVFFHGNSGPFAFAEGLAGRVEVIAAGLGAISRADGYVTRNTQDMRLYLANSSDYRNILTSVQEYP